MSETYYKPCNTCYNEDCVFKGTKDTHKTCEDYQQKSNREIIEEILQKQFEKGYEMGKCMNWRRGKMDGKPVLVDYDKQLVWTEAIPLTQSKGLVLDKDSYHDAC